MYNTYGLLIIEEYEMEFNISLSDEALLFLAETIALAYGSYVRQSLENGLGKNSYSAELILDGVETSLRESVRKLLRKPLQNGEFRRRFYSHFSTHDHDSIRELAWPWMEECLTWET